MRSLSQEKEGAVSLAEEHLKDIEPGPSEGISDHQRSISKNSDSEEEEVEPKSGQSDECS